jgi:maltose alpha-D-glucosyltransferase/alpha-amylase
MDFFLDFDVNKGGYKSLFRDYDLDLDNKVVSENHSFFKKDGNGDIRRFLDEYLPFYESAKNKGHVCLVTGNHDVVRLRYELDPAELALAYAFIFTMPGVPYLYYGDEIGMRYLNLPTKEGGYYRTGSRTPMQWNSGKNLGFSTADASRLYLPVDPSTDAPTVEGAEKDNASLLNTVKALLKLRRSEADLQSTANLEVLYAEQGKVPFVYKRASFVIGVNPSGSPALVKTVATAEAAKGVGKAVFTIGEGALEKGECRLGAQSFVVWKV